MKPGFQKFIIVFFWICGIVTLAAVVILAGFLIKNGMSAISTRLIFGDVAPFKALLFKERVFDGLFPAIIGTFLVVVLSVTWAVPLGIAAGIYLAEFSSDTVKKIFNFSLDILASVPSIVIGLFGLVISIFLHRHLSAKIYPCLFISSIALSVLVLPYIVRTTQLSLEAVPYSMRLAGMSLGASQLENLYYILLPQSFTGILSGIILALGRSAEDTAVIMMTGVVATAGIPKSLLAKYEALPFYIYYISSQYKDHKELMAGFGAALILVLICTIMFITAHLFKNIAVKHFSVS